MSCALCGVAGVEHASALGCVQLLQHLLRVASIDADEQRLIGYGEAVARYKCHGCNHPPHDPHGCLDYLCRCAEMAS